MKCFRLLSAAALCAALLGNAGCFRKQEYIPMNKQMLKAPGKVYFVPLGDFSVDLARELATYYRNKYQLKTETLPSVPLSREAFNLKRGQLIAEEAIEIIKHANPDIQNDPQAILIGLTNRDMYIAKHNWQFSFSWRDEGKYAVVSSGRMHLTHGRQQITEGLIVSRLRKMVTKNVGILYFNLGQNDHPRSVLYRAVGGVRELDYMGEDF